MAHACLDLGCISAGRFQESESSTACLDCGPGTYCKEGASAALPCAAGRYSAASNVGSADACSACPPGSFCFAGATAPSPCSAGTHATNARSTLCDPCPVGTYQSVAGSVACLACGTGFLCAEGSSVRLPASCPLGTFLEPGAAFNSEADCTDCPPGSACYGGSSAPKVCRPGSYAAVSGLGECSSCGGGTYQPLSNGTACASCAPGGFCPPGSTLSQPCPGGFYANRSGLADASQCTPVAAGFWASLGSELLAVLDA